MNELDALCRELAAACLRARRAEEIVAVLTQELEDLKAKLPPEEPPKEAK